MIECNYELFHLVTCKNYFINGLNENWIQPETESMSLTCPVSEYLTTRPLAPSPLSLFSQSILLSQDLFTVPGAPLWNLTGTMYRHVNT